MRTRALIRLLPAPAPAPSLGQALLDCHERIRRFCGGMLLLCEHLDPHDPRVVNTAERVARYLRVGLPLHAQDEDESLTPRLTALTLPDEVQAALAQQQEEHLSIESLRREVVLGLERAVSHHAPLPVVSMGHLTPLLLAHIDAEERLIFPHIERLPQEEQQATLRELQRRRQSP